MKILVWCLILTFTLTAVQADPNDPSNSAHSEQELSGKPTNGELEYLNKIARHDDSKIRSLAQSICTFYGLAGVNFEAMFNTKVKRYMSDFEGINNPTPKQITDFLNRNKDKMTCGSGKNKKNYMMVAFDESSHISLFRKVFQRQYMKKDRSAIIDVNAVSYTGPGGTPETVIDYMDGVLADKSNAEGILKEVTKLRKFFVKKLGAKNFKDLPADEQAKFIRTDSL